MGDVRGHMTSPPQTAAWFMVVELVPKALRAGIAVVVSLTNSRVLGTQPNDYIIIQ